MAHVTYNRGKARLFSGDLDLDADTIGVLLAQPGYTPNPDHNVVGEVTNELAGGTYVRKTTTGKIVTEDDANDRAVWTHDAITWAALQTAGPAGQTYAWAVYFEDAGGTDATRHLIVAIDLVDQAADGTDFVLQPGANGVLTLN